MQPRLQSKTLEDYVVQVHRLEKVLNILTKPYCQTCTLTPHGCCHQYEFYSRGMPEDFLAVQLTKAGICEEELFRRTTADRRDYKCGFLQKGKGCLIEGYKSPLCIGHLCGDIERELTREFEQKDPLLVEQFISAMEVIAGSSHIPMEEYYSQAFLFQYLEQAIINGKKLAKIKLRKKLKK